jgi:histidyl-tRNA synthetase
MPLVLRTLQALRAAGVGVQMHARAAGATPASAGEGMGSMKSQFKKADASGARYALIFGSDELAQGVVTVKSLRDGAGAQVQQPLDAPERWAASLNA